MSRQPPAGSRAATILGAALCLALYAETASSGGLYVPNKGATGLALANAGDAARADDPSTVYANPAGMTRLDAAAQIGLDRLSVPIRLVDVGSTAATPGTAGEVRPYAGAPVGRTTSKSSIPSIYIVRPLPAREIWLGLAATVPYGLDVRYPSDWFGRYDSVRSELLTFDFAPSAAFRINEQWSVGGGLNIQYADAKLSYALVDPLNVGGPTPDTDAVAALDGSDWSLGYNVGVMWQPADSTRLGLHYRSRVRHDLQGTAAVAGLRGPLAGFNGSTDARTRLNLPDIVSVGLAQSLSPSLTLHVGITRFGWKTFDEVRIRRSDGSDDIVRPQHFSSSRAVSLGVTWRAGERWTMRTGIQLDETPTTDEWRNTSIPDGDLRLFGAGFTRQLTARLALDFAFMHMRFGRKSIALPQSAFDDTPLESLAITRGQTDNRAATVSLGIRYRLRQSP